MARIVRIHAYGDASVLKLEDVDVPAPAADEVQIDVKAFGLNRAEVMFRNHAYLQEAEFPSRLGYEAAGVVIAVGTGVTDLQVGDAVSVIPPLDIARSPFVARFQTTWRIWFSSASHHTGSTGTSTSMT